MIVVGSGKIEKNWFLAAIDSEGSMLYKKQLPSRAHHISVNQSNTQSLIIARRPGYFARLFDSVSGQTIKEITPPKDHYFFGHSCINKTNIFISCGDINSSGKLAIYDLNLNFEYFIELNNFGPHQIELIDDQNIAIAIGGLKTIDREILNLENFQSELVIVNLKQKKITQRYSLENKKLSLRHLHTFNKKIIIAAQIPDRESLFDDLNTPLLYELKTDKLQAIAHPNWNEFNQYIASVSFDDNQLIATSPMGHCLSIWSKQNEQFQFTEQLDYVDIASITQLNDHAYWSTGAGISAHKENKSITISKQDIHWDNHWKAIYV